MIEHLLHQQFLQLAVLVFQRAQTLGVNARLVKIAGFALSAFFAGALGAAMAVRWTYIDPPAVFNPFIGFQTVLIAMVGGAHTVLGPLVSSIVFSLLTELLMTEKSYIGSIGGSCTPDRDFPTFLEWHADGRLRLDDMVTERFALDEVNEAVDALSRGKISGRAIFVM